MQKKITHQFAAYKLYSDKTLTNHELSSEIHSHLRWNCELSLAVLRGKWVAW